MVNTMADLREEVASRLRNSLHGREIDMMESVKPRLPHMLGITPLGKSHDPNNEQMTLLDTQHPFWHEYEEDIRTQNQVTEKLETAIRSLREDNIFNITHPYGEEAEIMYCEVEKLQPSASDMKTSCKDCGSLLTTQPNLDEESGHYYLKFSMDCPDCEFSGTYKEHLTRG
jgi:hypothetical protein